MGTLPFLARQLIVVGGFAVAIAAPMTAVLAATPAGSPTYVAQCTGGDEPDPFTYSCVPFMTPSTPGASGPASADASAMCPAGVTGTECAKPGGGGEEPGNPAAGGAAAAAAGTEQVGEDVAGAEGGLGAP
jgi:hypothetical protein